MRFKDWSEVFLEDVAAELTVGFVGSMRSEYIDSGVPFLRSKNIDPYGINWNDMRFIGREFHERLKKSALVPGDVVIVRTGKPGTATLIPKSLSEANCSDVVIVRPGPQLDATYLVYYLNSAAVHHIDSHLVGAVQQHFNVGAARKLQINLPSLPEQQAIAQVLSSLDDKIDLLHRQNKTLEAIAETLFRQWFIEEPEASWEEKPLSTVASFLNGLACQKFPPDNDLEKLPVLKIRELKTGIGDDCDYVTTDVDPKYIVDSGDVIFAWSASLVVKIWNDRKCILNQHLFKVTSKNFPKWFYYYWCKFYLREFIAISQAHATTMGHIKRGDLDDAMVLVPSANELKDMHEKMSPVLSKVESNDKKIRTIEKLRDTLLPKLMSGEVRVEL